LKKFLKWLAAGTGLLLAASIVAMWVIARFFGSTASAEATSAMVPSERIEVIDGDTMAFVPRGAAPGAGLLLIPGAFCDPKGYAPVLRRIAEAGFLVVVVRQPLDLSELRTLVDPDWPIDVQKRFPQARRWVLVGHSIGATTAAQFAHDYPGAVDGLVLWDGLPPGGADLSQSRLPVWHIHRATPAGVAPEIFAARRARYPADSRWVPIAGGVHLYFGSFDGGIYREQWPASISRAEQQDQVVAATVAALREVASAGPR
jgi:pimeloyl-ACP methyl ester carboxylesterase